MCGGVLKTEMVSCAIDIGDNPMEIQPWSAKVGFPLDYCSKHEIITVRFSSGFSSFSSTLALGLLSNTECVPIL